MTSAFDFRIQYFDVPFDKKDDFKKLGGKFDMNKKMWYMDASHKNLSIAEKEFGTGTQRTQSQKNLSIVEKDFETGTHRTPEEDEKELEELEKEFNSHIQYFFVPYEQWDEFKRLGGRRNLDNKRWYMDLSNNNLSIAKQEFVELDHNGIRMVKYFDVPFKLKEEMKTLGGRWNNKNKKWYIGASHKNIEIVKKKFQEIDGFD